MIHVNLSFRVSLCVYGVQGWSPWRPQAMARLIKESVCLSLSLSLLYQQQQRVQMLCFISYHLDLDLVLVLLFSDGLCFRR